MEERMVKIYSQMSRVPLKIIGGHFATNHSHINYYIDMTTLKTRLSEAMMVAEELTAQYRYLDVVDTIVCLDGMQVVGAFLAAKLEQAGVKSTNEHKTIYVVTPEFNSNSQMIFRDNIAPMIHGKNILMLMASVTTGLTINKGVECIQYYGGKLRGISSIFSAIDALDGIEVNSVFTKKDLTGYQTYDYRNCPFCKKGIPLDALVNSYGYSKL
ncbi:MAG: orotate phosphoribosyltransferase [bacterium]|nr:orotate phosphoribosyltransferase [bacterium]